MKADGPFPEPLRREYTALVQLPDQAHTHAVIHHRADAPHHRLHCTVTIVHTQPSPDADGTRPTGFHSYTIPARRSQGALGTRLGR